MEFQGILFYKFYAKKFTIFVYDKKKYINNDVIY